MKDWEVFSSRLACTSLRAMARATAHTVPTARKSTLITKVFRVMVQAQLDLKKYSKFFSPTNGLKMPVL